MGAGQPRAVVVVEDRPSMFETVAKVLDRIGGVQRRWAPHHTLVGSTDHGARRRAAAMLGSSQLVLLDAFDRDSAQDDPTMSRLQSLPVLDLLRDVPDDSRPRVVAYSTSMARPEVHLTLWSTGLVWACYTASALADHLGDVLAGSPNGALTPPSPDAWHHIDRHLRPGADLADVHRQMAANPRAWRLVCEPDAPFDQAAQKWIRRNVLPLLTDEDSASYRLAVDVTRRIAGLSNGN